MNGDHNSPAPQSTETDLEETWSIDDESFSCYTLGDLIYTYGDSLEVGQTVYVGIRVLADESLFFDADDLLDTLGERAYDNHGEAAEGWPEVTPKAKKEFNDFLANWIAEHCPARFYGVRDVKPYTLTAEDLKQ